MENKYIINSNGILTFSESQYDDKMSMMSEHFNICVGMVTGRESVFKNSEYGNIFVRNGETKLEKYILISEYPTNDRKLNKYMLENKTELIKRKIRKFNQDNWFEWGALRNIKTIQENLGKPCILRIESNKK